MIEHLYIQDEELSYTSGFSEVVDYHIAITLGFVPLELRDGYLICAVSNHISASDYNLIKFVVRKDVRFILFTQESFDRLVDSTWSLREREKITKDQEFKAQIAESSFSGTNFTLQTLSTLTVSEIVDKCITQAIALKASDIHIEPYELEINVRYRIDGTLQSLLKLEKQMQNPLISRLKILSKMDIAEKRLPQDGRIVVDNGNRKIDIRVSTLPTHWGEKVVMRLLDKSSQRLDIHDIGFSPATLTLFKREIEKTSGIILVTGPTGSGKTTTLYSALQAIQRSEINISTVEDPIEYQIEGINQTQMNGDIGYSFANAIKTFLRQDPDVIMVGEIRDPETAKYAIQAAQTGHLVFSTLHTNDAASAIIRLVEMGIEPFLVASTINMVVAQRLLRRNCPQCKEESPISQGDIERLREIGENISTGWIGRGCSHCGNVGYSGRISIFELMRSTHNIQEMVINRDSSYKIKQQAIADGMVTLRNEALRLFKNGDISINEIKPYI